MKVSTIIGAHAYAVIKTETGSMDVLLSAGRSPAKSLRESAREFRESAEDKLRRAMILEQAAELLEKAK